jgi:hypothetical protein
MTIPDLLQFADERGILAAIPGRQKEYLLTSLSSPHRIGMYMRVPIGAYGSSFASRLSRTATLLCDMIEQDRELAGDLWHTVDAHYNVVANHSTRGRANRAVTQGVNYGNQESAIVAAQEGIISMVAAINMLTAEQVPGFEREDGAERLLEQLAKDDMLNKLTLFIAQGVAGSVGVNGIYIPGMVQNEGGKLSFSEDALARLESLRNGVTAIMHARWTDYHARAAEKGVEAADAELPQVLLGLPCLAAGPYRRPDGSLTPGAITRLTSTFVKVFNSITPTYKQPRVVFPWLGPRVYQE